jgi:hypothetical protein
MIGVVLVLFGSLVSMANEVIFLNPRSYQNDQITNVQDGDTFTKIESDGTHYVYKPVEDILAST